MAPSKTFKNAGKRAVRQPAMVAGLLALTVFAGCQSRKTGESAPASGVSVSGDTGTPDSPRPLAVGVSGTQGRAAAEQAESPLAVNPRVELKASDAGVQGGVASTAKVAEPVAAESAVSAPECVTVTFHHRATSKHALGEECVLHGNRIELPEVLRNPKLVSFCVRVDGAPVRAVREKNHFTLAATRKPNSVITVQGCPRDKACAQDCTPARDAFLDGLVGDAGEANGAGWKGEADAVAALDPAVKRELAALDDESVSDAWDSAGDAPAVAACASKVARSDRAGK